jgi:hypothetical protein
MFAGSLANESRFRAVPGLTDFADAKAMHCFGQHAIWPHDLSFHVQALKVACGGHWRTVIPKISAATLFPFLVIIFDDRISVKND